MKRENEPQRLPLSGFIIARKILKNIKIIRCRFRFSGPLSQVTRITACAPCEAQTNPGLGGNSLASAAVVAGGEKLEAPVSASAVGGDQGSFFRKIVGANGGGRE
jgi:hypothetical protein